MLAFGYTTAIYVQSEVVLSVFLLLILLLFVLNLMQARQHI